MKIVYVLFIISCIFNGCAISAQTKDSGMSQTEIIIQAMKKKRIVEGMTRDQVKQIKGEPDRVEKIEPPWGPQKIEELWHYHNFWTGDLFVHFRNKIVVEVDSSFK